MKKIILAGASTFAILAFASAANAQSVDVILDLDNTLSAVAADTDGFGGVYINAAVNNAGVDGSVDIDTDGLIDGLNASQVTGSLEVSVAGAGAEAESILNGGGEAGIDGAGAIGLALAGAGQVNLDIIGTTIASTDVIKTTAIGAVNTGVTSLAAIETSFSNDTSRSETDAGDLAFASSAANSASNTTNTAASAAAAATSLLIDGATSTLQNNIQESTTAGPAAIVAANLAVNNGFIDGSVDIFGATAVDIAGTATTAIGAVNTGTITNGLPGSITIVAGDTSSTTTTNTNSSSAE